MNKTYLFRKTMIPLLSTMFLASCAVSRFERRSVHNLRISSLRNCMMCLEYISDCIAGTNWVGNVAEGDTIYVISNRCFRGADKFTCSLVVTNSPMVFFATVAFDSSAMPLNRDLVEAFSFACINVYEGMCALSRGDGYTGRAELLLNFLDDQRIYDASADTHVSKREFEKLMDSVGEYWRTGLYGMRGSWLERFPAGDMKVKHARDRSFFGSMTDDELATSKYVLRKYQNFVNRTYCGTNWLEVGAAANPAGTGAAEAAAFCKKPDVPGDCKRFRLSKKSGGSVGMVVVSLAESESPMLFEINVAVDPLAPRSYNMEGAVMHQIADGIFDYSMSLGFMPPEVLFLANGHLHDSYANKIDAAKHSALARRAAFQFEHGLYSRPIEEFFQ